MTKATTATFAACILLCSFAAPASASQASSNATTVDVTLATNPTITVYTDGVNDLYPYFTVKVSHVDTSLTCIKMESASLYLDAAKSMLVTSKGMANGSPLCTFGFSDVTMTNVSPFSKQALVAACNGKAGQQTTASVTLYVDLNASPGSIGFYQRPTYYVSIPVSVAVSCAAKDSTAASVPPVSDPPNAGTTATTPPPSTTPLPTTITNATITTVKQSVKPIDLPAETLAKWALFGWPSAAMNQLIAAQNSLQAAWNNLSAVYTHYASRLTSCETQSYTPQQMQSICAPTDTVQACGDKLVRACMGSLPQALTSARQRVNEDSLAVSAAAAKLASLTK